MLEPKDVRLTFTVTARDEDLLKELAADADVSMSHVVRKLVREAHAARFGEKKRPRK